MGVFTVYYFKSGDDMRKVYVISLMLLLVFLSACSKEIEVPFIETVDEKFVMDYDGVNRSYYVYVPEGVKEGSPMLIMLHGYGSTIELFVETTDLKELADRDKVVLVYPEGTKAVGLNHWNAHLRYEDVDDIGFLRTLRNQLVEEYNINEEEVFIGGHSNGGFMAYTMACEENDLFQAYMSVSGTMSGETWETCDVNQETNIFQFHGTNDFVVPIDGTMTEMFGWGGAPRIEEMLTIWTDVLIDKEETVENINEDVTVSSYLSSSNHKVVFVKAERYGHMWADDGDLFDEENDLSDISELFWDYMMSLIED